MCLVLYSGTTTDIPLIAWDEKKPAFNVEILKSEFQKNAVRHFGELKVHYIGSDNGCGCGFRKEEDVFIAKFQEPGEEKQVNHDALARYLEKLPQQKSPIKLFACWSGDEELPILTHRQISLAEISKPDFFFREREMLTVI